jgi:hypothetical protein
MGFLILYKLKTRRSAAILASSICASGRSARGTQYFPYRVLLAVPLVFTAFAFAQEPVSPQVQTLAILPDAPTPAASVMEGATDSSSVVAATTAPERAPTEDCSLDTNHSRTCRVHWHQLIISSAVFNAFQNTGNLYTGYWYRWETTHGNWFDRWIDSAADWHWNSWADQNPFLDDYVGHPMMGAITNDLWIQNDPKSMTVEQSNSWPYWRRMLRAGAFSTFYSFEWKLGPLGEAGFGHDGDHVIDESGGRTTTETGWVELVTTPVGGALWTMAEDALDKHVVAPVESPGRNPFALLGLSFLEPAHATANIFRFRPPWYRDDRVVKAKSFWSDPAGEDEVRFEKAATASADSEESAESSSALPAAVIRTPSTTSFEPVWAHPGGVHEFGTWWGLSLISGHIWGYAGDIKYMPIDVRYTYLISPHQFWTLRYAPEVTALAMLDQPVPGAVPTPPYSMNLRERVYGSGISPVGFETDFLPDKRVQPFLSTNGGALYFDDRVLSPQGSQFMYTIDFGTGIHIFRKARQDWSLGYRYQHLSNANISLHNPGTDANTFYVAVSRFRTKGYR